MCTYKTAILLGYKDLSRQALKNPHIKPTLLFIVNSTFNEQYKNMDVRNKLYQNTSNANEKQEKKINNKINKVGGIMQSFTFSPKIKTVVI